ncbi:LAFE_0H01838g1_1 [Lachancea fermentati]|uniref:LAFE_0H01838g1_1 n=1 Tax=Lachancea fermentati TaxID=4955 RepID=A0A1G4MJE2_LACFM|nr:LAFE_0H01838g1_1 [Lachancea fermentati]
MAAVPQAPGVPGQNGQQRTLASYLRYVLVAIALFNVIKKTFDSPKTVNPLRPVEGDLDTRSLSFSQRLSRHILNGALEKKGMKAEDLKKSKQRVAYEQGLNLHPIEGDIFVFHQPPVLEMANITSTVYINGTIPEEVEEEVPTREFLVYGNSQLPPQLFSPALGPEDDLQFEFFINTNKTFEREDYHSQGNWKLRGGINNIYANTIPWGSLEYSYILPEDYNSEPIYLHLYLSKDRCYSTDDNSNDVCDFHGKRTIELTYMSSKTRENDMQESMNSNNAIEKDNLSNEDGKSLYYYPRIEILIGKPIGILTEANVPSYLKGLMAFDESGRRDNTTGMAQAYFPPVLHNNLMRKSEDVIELNSSISILPVYLTVKVPKPWKFYSIAYVQNSLMGASEVFDAYTPQFLKKQFGFI